MELNNTNALSSRNCTWLKPNIASITLNDPNEVPKVQSICSHVIFLRPLAQGPPSKSRVRAATSVVQECRPPANSKLPSDPWIYNPTSTIFYSPQPTAHDATTNVRITLDTFAFFHQHNGPPKLTMTQQAQDCSLKTSPRKTGAPRAGKCQNYPLP